MVDHPDIPDTAGDDDMQDTADQAMQKLVAKDRVLVEARMLPNRKLSASQVKDIAKRVKEIALDPASEISLAKIAAEVSYSPGVITDFANGKYKGNVDQVARALNLWLERWARREQSKGKRQYISTWACEAMTAFIRFCHAQESMGTIVAPSGSGKDMVIGVLAEQLNGIVIECHMKTSAKELMIDILHALNVPGKLIPPSAAACVRMIVGKMKDRAATIFLNEAQQLKKECASLIRTIYDQTHVPVIMLGSQEILAWIDDRASGGGQFHRRCKKFDLLAKMKRAEDPDHPGKFGRKLYSKKEIARFLEMKQIRLWTPDAFEMLHALACMIDAGSLGLVNAIVEGACYMNPGIGIDAELTADAIVEQLFLQLENEAPVLLDNLQLDETEQQQAMAG